MRRPSFHPIASPLGEWSCVALSGVEEPMGPIYCSSLIATPGSFTIMLCRMLLFFQSYQNRSFNPHIHFGDVAVVWYCWYLITSEGCFFKNIKVAGKLMKCWPTLDISSNNSTSSVSEISENHLLCPGRNWPTLD